MEKITRVNVKKMLASDSEINMHVHTVDTIKVLLLLPFGARNKPHSGSLHMLVVATQHHVAVPCPNDSGIS